MRNTSSIHMAANGIISSFLWLSNIPLYICIHPDKNEVAEGKYNEKGEEIIKWCQENGISPILELNEGIKLEMFRDGIHTNEKGQRFEAKIMKKYIVI